MSASSRATDVGESAPARIERGASLRATAVLVGPIKARHAEMASTPDSSNITTGPELIKSTSAP
eukprot:scaffold1996_cov132-Isochrysis_galbana.AAC.4